MQETELVAEVAELIMADHDEDGSDTWSPDGICLLMKIKLRIVIKLLLRAQILMKPKDSVLLVTQNMNMAVTQCWKIVQIKLFM